MLRGELSELFELELLDELDEPFDEEFELELLEEFELELLDEFDDELLDELDEEFELEFDELLPTSITAPSPFEFDVFGAMSPCERMSGAACAEGVAKARPAMPAKVAVVIFQRDIVLLLHWTSASGGVTARSEVYSVAICARAARSASGSSGGDASMVAT